MGQAVNPPAGQVLGTTKDTLHVCLCWNSSCARGGEKGVKSWEPIMYEALCQDDTYTLSSKVTHDGLGSHTCQGQSPSGKTEVEKGGNISQAHTVTSFVELPSKLLTFRALCRGSWLQREEHGAGCLAMQVWESSLLPNASETDVVPFWAVISSSLECGPCIMGSQVLGWAWKWSHTSHRLPQLHSWPSSPDVRRNSCTLAQLSPWCPHPLRQLPRKWLALGRARSLLPSPESAARTHLSSPKCSLSLSNIHGCAVTLQALRYTPWKGNYSEQEGHSASPPKVRPSVGGTRMNK